MKRLLAVTLMCCVGAAQDQAPRKGSIRGVVRDETSGAPVDGATVSVSGRPVRAVSDAQGRFALEGLDPGRLQIGASGPMVLGVGFPVMTLRFATLAAGQELENYDIPVRTRGQVSGIVRDQNDQPLPDVSVALIAREMQLGRVRYVFAAMGRTDDQGKYVVSGTPGRSYLVMAMKNPGSGDAIADAPLDPKRRRPAFVPTFYPGVDTLAGAQVVPLASGTKKENVDIRILRGPSFCAEGVVSVGGAPAEMVVNYVEAEPHSGLSGDGGFYAAQNSARTGPDGRVRVCGLHAGQYRFTASPVTASPLAPPSAFVTGVVNITDSDARISFSAGQIAKIASEWVWAESPLDGFKPPNNWFAIVQPLTRTGSTAETRSAALPKAGEEFTMNLFPDEFRMQFDVVPPGTYLKELTYGSKDLRREALVPGSAVGDAKVRIVLAHDGGTLKVQVADKEGKGFANQYVLVFPVTATTAEVLAESVTAGQTDQAGAWTSPMLRPGSYFVLGGSKPFDRSPETLASMLGARSRLKQVEIGTKSSVDLSVEPLNLP